MWPKSYPSSRGTPLALSAAHLLLVLLCFSGHVVECWSKAASLPASLPNYDRDGRQELVVEPWPDTPRPSPEEQAELDKKAVFYQQDTASLISNLVSDDEAGDIQQGQDELATSTAVVSTKLSLPGTTGSTEKKAAKVTCSSSLIKSRIDQANASIAGAAALLSKASAQGESAAKAFKPLKWMTKWLKDAAAFLKARNFKKGLNKLVAVANNLGYAQSLSSKPAADYIKAAAPQVQAAKTLAASLARCTTQTTLTVQSLPTSPLVTIPNTTPYTAMQGLQNPGGAAIDGPDFNLTLDTKTAMVRVNSADAFDSGVFTVSYKCPSSFEGVITGFYLSSNDNFTNADIIQYEVLGNRPDRVRVGLVVNGTWVYMPAIDLGVDCSKDFHQYTIMWEADTIRWLFDGEILRHMDRNDPNSRFSWLSASTMRVYASIRRATSWGVGTYDPTKAPFVAAFADLKITSPVNARTLPAVPSWPRATWPLTRFSIDYSRDSVTRLSDNNEIVMAYDPSQGWWGGRVVSPKRFSFGEFSAQIRCPQGNASGLVTSFYLSSMEGGSYFLMQDEIDFEFLGKNSHLVQLTCWVSGRARYSAAIDLGFDCSAKFHLYTLRWKPSEITWLVDNKVVLSVPNDGIKPFPIKPSYLYTSVWSADSGWAGKYFGMDAPYFGRYRNITMTSPLS